VASSFLHLRLRRWLGRVVDLLLWPLALGVVLAEIVVWRNAAWLGRALSHAAGLPRLQARLGRLPPVLALPMFLVPEAASRVGALWAAWLLVQGHYRAAAAVYAGSKIVASLVAAWIYRACEPALLTVPWFAQVRAGVLRVRDWALSRAARWLRRSSRDGSPGRFVVQRRRIAASLGRLARPGSSAAAPVPATASEPTAQPPTA